MNEMEAGFSAGLSTAGNTSSGETTNYVGIGSGMASTGSAGFRATASRASAKGTQASSVASRAFAFGRAVALMATNIVAQTAPAGRGVATTSGARSSTAGNSPSQMSYDWGSYADLNVAATIGAWTDWWGAPESTFDGWIDDVRFYDRGLAASELIDSPSDTHADPDGDGLDNLAEYLLGRDPCAGVSYVSGASLAFAVLTPLEP